MAYTITKSDGSTLAVVSSNTVDTTSTSIALHGKGRLQYGQKLDENFVHMLEHFANDTPPSNPIIGQVWLDTSAGIGSPVLGVLKFFDNTGNWQSLLTSGGIGDLVISGNILFTIPSTGLPADSDGITWTGNTDEMRMYVEEFSTESSELVLQVSNDGGDQSSTIADGFSIRGKISSEAFPATIARFVKQAGGSGVMLMTADDGTGAPQRSNDLVNNYTIILNEGAGDSASAAGGPDIRFNSQGFISAGNAIYLNINDSFTNSVPGSSLVITTGGSNSANATQIAKFDSNGNLFCAGNVGGNDINHVRLGATTATNVTIGSSTATVDTIFAWNTAIPGRMNFQCNRLTATDDAFTPQGWSINANVKRIVNVNNGINNLDAVNVSQLNAAIAGAAITKSFSGPFNLNGGGPTVLVWSHGLGGEPDFITVIAQNIIAEGGYGVGTRLVLSTGAPQWQTNADSNEQTGIALQVTPTAVILRASDSSASSTQIWAYSTANSRFRLTPGRWQLYFKAMRV